MTNEELDRARAEEAQHLWVEAKYDAGGAALIAARLAREGWTPPVAVDPDLLELETLWLKYTDGKINSLSDTVLAGIKRGRELERAEAKPGMVWVKHDGGPMPTDRDEQVAVIYDDGELIAGVSHEREWSIITHYTIITQPEEN
jgi:hypothetical protein